MTTPPSPHRLPSNSGRHPAIHAASPESIAAAALALKQGELVAFPTETVYGLGANATDDKAVTRIFAAKGRPRFNPLIVHVGNLAAAQDLVVFGQQAHTLAEAFWPGALTLVLPRRPDCPVSLLASAGLDTLAVRVPNHAIAHALLEAADMPLAAPSANPSGAVSPTTADHVAEGLGGKVAMILDGGSCRVGVESTVVTVAGDIVTLLRPGGVTGEAIESVVGPIQRPLVGDDSAPHSPGMLASHYAPHLPLRLEATNARPGEALLAFGKNVPPGFSVVRNLSEDENLNQAAANLFAMLRELDRPDHSGIAVMAIPERDLGQAINDRLRRAAAPRD